MRVRPLLVSAITVAIAPMMVTTEARAQAATDPTAPASIDEAITPLTDDPRGPLLFKLDYWLNRPKDNMIVLVGGAARSTGVTMTGTYPAKYRWNFDFDSTGDEFVWTVELSEPTTFNVRVSVGSGPGDEFLLDVPGTSNSLSFGPSDPSVTALIAEYSMDLLEPGTITIPAGRQELRFRKSAAGSNSVFKSIELIRSSDYPAYQQRVKDFRVDTSWLRGKTGYMLQWGGWSYPRFGPAGTWQDTWNEFDVDSFVDEMVKSKVDYVLWSVTWAGYMFPGPNQAIDDILGPDKSDRTADRDLLMEIAQALQAKGIDLTVYYHLGHDKPLSGDWWEAQKFPEDTFRWNAYGDRSTMFDNWKAVVGEMGQHYGPLIKGFFFDDGLIYYPGDFEELGAVARTGNPDRFVSYNAFKAARYTDFQDVNFGEQNCVGPTDFDGQMLVGPHKGLFEHCMFRLHNDWGSRIQDWANPGVVKPPEEYFRLSGFATEQGAVSLNNMMFNGPTFIDRYADGSIGDGNTNMAVAAEMPKRYVTDIEVDINGALYGVWDRNLFTSDVNGNWRRFNAPSGDEYGLQQAGLFYLLDDGDLYRVHATGRTDLLNGEGFDVATISVGADRSVYGLTTSGDLVRWTQGSWNLMPTRMTGLTAVSVGKDYTNVWFLDAKGKPHHFNGRSVSSYSKIDMTFTRIEAATNGDMFAIDTDGALWKYRGRNWTKLDSIGPVSDVTATSHDDFYFIRSDNRWIGHYDGSDTITAVRSIIR